MPCHLTGFFIDNIPFQEYNPYIWTDMRISPPKNEQGEYCKYLDPVYSIKNYGTASDIITYPPEEIPPIFLDHKKDNYLHCSGAGGASLTSISVTFPFCLDIHLTQDSANILAVSADSIEYSDTEFHVAGITIPLTSPLSKDKRILIEVEQDGSDITLYEDKVEKGSVVSAPSLQSATGVHSDLLAKIFKITFGANSIDFKTSPHNVSSVVGVGTTLSIVVSDNNPDKIIGYPTVRFTAELNDDPTPFLYGTFESNIDGASSFIVFDTLFNYSYQDTIFEITNGPEPTPPGPVGEEKIFTVLATGDPWLFRSRFSTADQLNFDGGASGRFLHASNIGPITPTTATLNGALPTGGDWTYTTGDCDTFWVGTATEPPIDQPSMDLISIGCFPNLTDPQIAEIEAWKRAEYSVY